MSTTNHRAQVSEKYFDQYEVDVDDPDIETVRDCIRLARELENPGELMPDYEGAE